MISQLKTRVEGAEVGGDDGDEDDRHGGGLDQGVAVGPLDLLQLGPAGGEEADDRRLGASRPSRPASGARASCARAPAALLLRSLRARRSSRLAWRSARVGRRARRGTGSGLARAADGRRAPASGRSRASGCLGLLAESAIRRSRSRPRPRRRRPRPGPGCRAGRATPVALGAVALLRSRLLGLAGAALGLALCPGLRHRPPLAGFLVRRVAPAPAAVLAQLDPVRRVPARLVGLVVAPLALLAGERHSDAHISAAMSPRFIGAAGYRGQKNPRPGGARRSQE